MSELNQEKIRLVSAKLNEKYLRAISVFSALNDKKNKDVIQEALDMYFKSKNFSV